MSDLVSTQAAIATDLEAFDTRITERGWTFDEEESDADFVFWLYSPSETDSDDDDLAPVTTIWMSAAEDAEVVHMMFAGSADSREFTPEVFFAHIDTVEAYRRGDPLPDVGDSA